MTARWLIPLLLMLTMDCATARRVLLDTGPRGQILFAPRTGWLQPTRLEPSAFKSTIAQLALELRAPARPQEYALRLFEVDARNGWFLYEPRSRRLTALGKAVDIQEEPSVAEAKLTRTYLRWCETTRSPGDCLRLLTENRVVTGDGRYALTMAFAQEAVLSEMMDALKGMAHPEAVLSAALWVCTTYMMLLTVPEPVSKGIAAVITVALISWIGIDTFWGLIMGFKRLVEESDRATTFDELREVGERYGKVMGQNAARAFVMLATAAIGNTVAGLAGRVPTLPGAVQAAGGAGAQLGIRLSALEDITAVAVSAESITVSLAAGAVSMAAWDARGGAVANPARSGYALHNTDNVIPVEEGLHSRVSAFYSSVRRAVTGSPLTRTTMVEHPIVRSTTGIRLTCSRKYREGNLVKTLEELVEQFAHHVAEQTDAIWRGDARAGNKHAKKYGAAFDKLRAQGDAGRDALIVLLKHPRMDVRVEAAAHLLRHCTEEAIAVLEEAARGQGMVPFSAQQALKRWKEGIWALDPL